MSNYKNISYRRAFRDFWKLNLFYRIAIMFLLSKIINAWKYEEFNYSKPPNVDSVKEQSDRRLIASRYNNLSFWKSFMWYLIVIYATCKDWFKVAICDKLCVKRCRIWHNIHFWEKKRIHFVLTKWKKAHCK